ncbi:hypothetical protein F66182_3943 [Fusarium sp. NRRL 66182]|nr:hypothetical protein F66182_3943 [Fusarium sp. NRRL 66182]
MYKRVDNIDAAKNYARYVRHRIVMKADGLTSGKGVALLECRIAAERELESIMRNKRHGAAGKSIVIEEYMEGDEIGILTFSDGKTFRSLPTSQDHERIFEGNKGSNTKGMGTILQPTFEGLKMEGRKFVGMLFTEIMITSKGPKVIEYNARFGDSETESAMMLLSEDTDLADVLFNCTTERVSDVKIDLRPGYSCNVVVTSAGYPLSYKTGQPITLGSCPEGVQILHARTNRCSGKTLLTNGGRVFTVAAWEKTLQEAVDKAYEGVESIHFEHMFFRREPLEKFAN